MVKKSQSKELTLRSLQEVKRCEIGIVMGAGDASTDGKGWVLSDEQKLKLQSAFCSIDANQDGTVDDSERRAARVEGAHSYIMEMTLLHYGMCLCSL